MRAALWIVLAAFALAACGEREQILEPHSEKGYRGKPDTPPWGEGDRAAWENALKARQYAQHEDRRIDQ